MGPCARLHPHAASSSSLFSLIQRARACSEVYARKLLSRRGPNAVSRSPAPARTSSTHTQAHRRQTHTALECNCVKESPTSVGDDVSECVQAIAGGPPSAASAQPSFFLMFDFYFGQPRRFFVNAIVKTIKSGEFHDIGRCQAGSVRPRYQAPDVHHSDVTRTRCSYRRSNTHRRQAQSHVTVFVTGAIAHTLHRIV